jgi:hypothetical protein
MYKITTSSFIYFWRILCLALTPTIAMAQSEEFYKARRAINQAADKVAESPIFGIVGYSLLAILLFVLAVMLIFFVYMIIKR